MLLIPLTTESSQVLLADSIENFINNYPFFKLRGLSLEFIQRFSFLDYQEEERDDGYQMMSLTDSFSKKVHSFASQFA